MNLLAFFFRKFTSAQLKYSVYNKELTAIYKSVCYFKHFLEGRDFQIVTDDKPLTHVFKQKLDKASPRQLRHLSFIAQFPINIVLVSNDGNVVADPLSCIKAFRFPMQFDFKQIFDEQVNDMELVQLLTSPKSTIRCLLKN